jgi:dTDP-4-dehydrorhamnose reductase
MNILLIGRVGQLGWELRRTLPTLGQVSAIDFPEIDLTKPDSIHGWLAQVRPALIVNAAAYTAVDKAESEETLALQLNGTAPGILAEWAKKNAALLVHYSTDYVYDGTKNGAYLESDRPNPLNAYGRTKLAGDQAITQADCFHLILRTSWVYGARGQNFLLTMRRLAQVNKELRVVNDQVGSPTWSRMIAEATSQILARLLVKKEIDIQAVYHLSANGQVSWFGFAQAILTKLKIAAFNIHNLSPIPSAQYPTPAQRPRNSVLSKARLHQDFGIAPPDWEQSLDLVIEEIGCG